jgi:hypothetical protein
MGAVSFIETMDHTSVSSVTQEEFERYYVIRLDFFYTQLAIGMSRRLFKLFPIHHL